MNDTSHIKRFATFALDTANQCIWRGNERVELPPKAWAVLAHLAANADRLVTKQELLDAVWPDTFVQEAVLKSCILEVRKALKDDSQNPMYIVTVHRRGYRFIPVPGETIEFRDAEKVPQPRLVAREGDLQRLRDLLARAQGGSRQLVFITGEPGIGKSTLISCFLSAVGTRTAVPVLTCQCIEHFSAAEAYYPIFPALARSLRSGGIPDLFAVLRRYAPTWLAQMPGFTTPAEITALKQEVLGAGRDRMMREMTEAVEVLASKEPLIVILEDLHWCDVSTLDLISAMASRSDHAKLLLIATYRPIDAILGEHPVRLLKQNLQGRGHCSEMELSSLRRKDIEELMALRFPDHDLPGELIRLVHHRTDGNPLFVSNVFDYAVSSSLIKEIDGRWRLNSAWNEMDLSVPDTISQVVENELERLKPEERHVLEMASVVGSVFSISAMASEDSAEYSRYEECCEGLVRRKLFIRSADVAELGQGRFSSCYEFTHARYVDVIYRRLSPARRIGLHRTIGERIEASRSGTLRQVASELAHHFERGRESLKAIRYLEMVAQRCAIRHALREGLGALSRALNLAGALPTEIRADVEIALIEQVGLFYRLMGEFTRSADEFERMCERARLAGNPEAQLRAQLWLASVTAWLDRTRCLRAVDQAVDLCPALPDEDLRANALGQLAYWNLLFRGWDERDLAASEAALNAARRSSDRSTIALHASRHAFFQALSSEYRKACVTAEEGTRLAIEIESLNDYSVGHFFECWALLHVGEWGQMRRLVHSAIELADKNGHSLWRILFGLMDALLHVQAFSFERARQMCAEYLPQAKQIGHMLSVEIGLVVLGMAELGLGNLTSAEEMLLELHEWQERDRILMDWIWRMPLEFAMTELFLAQGNSAAVAASERFLKSTSATAERTWRALAHHQRALVALNQDDRKTADIAVAEGLSLVETCEAPLAAWRLHALAGRIWSDEAHRAQSRRMIRKLADSFAQDDPLRRQFLTAAPIVAILSLPARAPSGRQG